MMAYQKKQNSFKSYVQLPLLPEHAAQVVSFSADDAGLMQGIAELVSKGYVLKISWNSEDENFQVATIQANPLSTDDGYGYFSGGNSVQEAIASAYVKDHFLVLAKGSLSGLSQQGRPKLY